MLKSLFKKLIKFFLFFFKKIGKYQDYIFEGSVKPDSAAVGIRSLGWWLDFIMLPIVITGINQWQFCVSWPRLLFLGPLLCTSVNIYSALQSSLPWLLTDWRDIAFLHIKEQCHFVFKTNVFLNNAIIFL